ncbi:DIE2/ALG10 family-domain-containing protein [Podospora didyma]|uniref:Dol-P-Glc:Glc(2)Man(9)GlcNAc(2)-PP-Dol alpha-1,2-glucosyltransferase n=1 Tax=Podospora didyma TaxID=330526 RepID=A0AAE0NYN6_9PEZI|nr:DIE2/ALG10 family-domain-containing protein [Podospora didyma]
MAEPKILPSAASWRSNLSTTAIYSGGVLFLLVVARLWEHLVNKHVPEPYLDEVFHIPQAQTYCKGRYWDWDDKITTPPGLYLLSVIYHKYTLVTECSAPALRSVSLLATLLIALVATLCRSLIETRTADRQATHSLPKQISFFSFHTGINIALFPVLFFFSGLYYTDVVSTLVVLVAYRNHLLRLAPESPGLANDVWTVIWGVAALFMRQTNVFWVVVYMGGLEAVHAVRSINPAPVEQPSKHLKLKELIQFHVQRYSVGDVHDPPLNLSWPDDWLFCLASLAIAAVHNPLRVLRQVWPHITVLGLFVGFVGWNGGVVLGDKSNHIATIHLAQMLYIWPFYAFFSAPLLIPFLLPAVISVLNSISRLVSGAPVPSPYATSSKARQVSANRTIPIDDRSLHLRAVDAFFAHKFYYIPYAVGTVLLSLAVVKFNTIIHPFTLADNRHYMFYVFRYTILRSGKVRYLLVAAYTVSRWLVWDQLAGSPSASPAVKYINTPFPTKEMAQAAAPANSADKNASKLDQTTLECTSTASPSTSTALLWLLTTALSLITAPLVEPRYFILPWVFWRLLVPAWSWPVQLPTASQRKGAKDSAAALRIGNKTDLRLVLETAWFLAINVGTMYMFLFRPFVWQSADGELLDGGRTQRFMW